MYEAKIFLDKKQEEHFKVHGVYADVNSKIAEWMQEYTDEVVKNLTVPNISVSVAEVRQAFADYYKSEGCTCCEDTEAHNKAEEKLAELLQPDQYDDESGFNWYKYATEY